MSVSCWTLLSCTVPSGTVVVYTVFCHKLNGSDCVIFLFTSDSPNSLPLQCCRESSAVFLHSLKCEPLGWRQVKSMPFMGLSVLTCVYDRYNSAEMGVGWSKEVRQPQFVGETLRVGAREQEWKRRRKLKRHWGVELMGIYDCLWRKQTRKVRFF